MRFEKVSYESFRKDMLKYGWREECIQTAYDNIKIPERKTKYSAGYDISTCLGFTMKPHERITIPTGIKAVFTPNEARIYHLQLFIRSSIGITRHVVMANQTGVIDADYAGNPDNDGDMLIALYNNSEHEVRFETGERLIQGIFLIHGLTTDDHASGERDGGVGSTGR